MTNILASSAFGYWYRNWHRSVYSLSNISRYGIISVTTATQIYTKNLSNYPCKWFDASWKIESTIC